MDLGRLEYIRKERFMKDKIEILALSNFLKSVWLNGTINECILKVKDGNCTINAIDATNSIFIKATAKIELSNIEIGILDLGSIIRVLDSCKDRSYLLYKIDDKTINFKIKKKGDVQFTLGKINVISSAVKDDLKKINDIVESKTLLIFKLSQGVVDNFKYFMKLFNSEVVTIEIFQGKIKIKGGFQEIKAFSFDVDSGNINKDIAILVNAKLLLSIFDLLPIEEDKTCAMGFEKDSPLIIKSRNATWLLSSITNDKQ